MVKPMPHGIKQSEANTSTKLNLYSKGGLLVKEQPLTEHDSLIHGRHVAIKRKIATNQNTDYAPRLILT